jgi:alkylmercury lyase
MNTACAFDMARRMGEDLLDYGPERSRLLIRVMRTLAQGRPVSGEQVDQVIADLGMAHDQADHFLRQITERDAEDHIVGIMGLSLNNHPHRIVVNGVSLTAWCAEDTLFLPALLKQTAVVESPSPVSNKNIHITISPEGVEAVSPADAVVSIVVVNPTTEHMASVGAIWNTFCRQIHFFASRAEAAQWTTGRDNIAILSVAEGFALGQQVWSRVLPYIM